MKRKQLMITGLLVLSSHFLFSSIALGYKPEAGSEAEQKPTGDWTVVSDPKLPNVLILGDSISIDYGLPLRKELEGKANVFRPLLNEGSNPENCEGTTFGVANIDRWIAGRKWDVIHFNFGLHDMKHQNPETGKRSNRPNDPRQASEEQYRINLEEIVGKLEATGATLIFATTTPVTPGTKTPLREPEAPIRYNKVATSVMKAHEIEVNDLFATVESRLEELQRPHNVHFLPEGSEVLAKQVAKVIQTALSKR